MGIWIMGSLLLLIAVTDWYTHRIPHIFTLGGMAGACILSPHLPAQFIINALAGGSLSLLLFLGIWIAAAKFYGAGALGFGDVMLAALIGTIGGVQIGLHALVVGMLLAGFASGIGLWAGWVSRTDRLPYGTFLALGSLIRFIFWYFN